MAGNGIFKKVTSAAYKMLRPSGNRQGPDEGEDEYEEYEEFEEYDEDDYPETDNSSKNETKSRDESENKGRTSKEESRSHQNRSSGVYGGYIDDDDLDTGSSSYAYTSSRPTFRTNVPPKNDYRAPGKNTSGNQTAYTPPVRETKRGGNVFQMNKASAPAARKFKFSIIRFEKLENSVIAADQMLAGDTVTLLDLHEIPENVARRVIDFLDGVRYTCDARIEQIADLTYVILPETVELTGDFKSQVDTNGISF